jgi:hypothetical protein
MKKKLAAELPRTNPDQNDKRVSLRMSPLAWAIGITIAFGVFQLPFGSFMADDFIQIGILEGVLPAKWLGPMDLYTLSDGNPLHMRILKDTGAFPWFWHPQFKARFFRPLSCASLILDHALFDLNPLGYNIHNILWFISLVIAAGILMQRVIPGRIAALAIIIFSLSGIHWYAIYWAAARHIIMAASLGLWALLAYYQWRIQGWKKGYPLSVLGILFSLSAGEASLGILAYLFAFELFSTHDSLKQKIKNLLPFIIMTVGYFIVYLALGYGAKDGGGYLNPFTEPLRFLTAAPGHFLALTGSIIAGGNTDFWMVPSLRGYIILISVLLLILLTILLVKVRPFADSKEIKSAGWLLPGAVISIIPFLSAQPGARLVVIPFIGGSVIISFVLHYWWRSLRKRPGIKVRFLSIFACILIVIHFGFAPIQRFAGPVFAKKVLVQRLELIFHQPEFNQKQFPERMIFLTVPDFSIGLHSFYYRKLYREPMPDSWWVLSWENCRHRVSRTDLDTLEMELINGSIHNPFLKKGTIIELTGLEITVLDADHEGAKRIRFRFDCSLNDPRLRFFAWKGGRLKNIQMPVEGGSIDLPAGKSIFF